MKQEIKEILIKNAKEYYRNALESEKRKEYNTAVTLFFKTLATLSDLYILIKDGRIPSNHTDRFKVLKEKHYEIYKIIDKDFPFYQDSYRIRLNKDVSIMLKEDVKKLFKILNISM